VAGNCDSGEDALVSAKRELREETGYQAQSIHSLGTILPSVGYCSETIEIFFAEVDNEPGNTDFDVDEHIETLVMSKAEMDERICSGEVDDGKTLAAWMLYTLKGA
jgi:ADP-ribose pyrophosphatase